MAQNTVTSFGETTLCSLIPRLFLLSFDSVFNTMADKKNSSPDNSIYLKVEISAGTDIALAAKDLIDTFKRLGIRLSASFNGMYIIVGSRTTVSEIIQKYADYNK